MGGDQQLEKLENMKDDELHRIFGGQQRIQRLKHHFKRLSSVKNMRIAIISFGFEQVIRNALQRLDLIKYFDEDLIIGNDSVMLQMQGGNKAYCLHKIAYGCVPIGDLCNRLIFVDDDESNIINVNKLNVAETMWIKNKNGITFEQMKMIEQRLGVYKELSIPTKEIAEFGQSLTSDCNVNNALMDEVIDDMQVEEK